MRHALQLIEATSMAALPILASASDVREVVQYLKKKPAGITVVEASDAIKKRLFDPRKVAAYEAWGIISKSGDRMKLNELGLELARALGPEAEIYRHMLDRTPPYHGLLRWIHEQHLELVTSADMLDYWEEHFPGAIQQGGKASKGHVDPFLQLCQAAEFGLATVGRKGQPSRLHVDRDELAFHITGKRREVSEPALRKDERPLHAITTNQLGPERVFISAPVGSEIVDSLRNVLGIAEIECEVVERDESLLPESSRDKMNRCDAGVIIVSDSDQATLIEIGAALSHFGRRVVILSQPNLQLKFNTDELCQYKIDGDELTLHVGLQIVTSLRARKD